MSCTALTAFINPEKAPFPLPELYLPRILENSTESTQGTTLSTNPKLSLNRDLVGDGVRSFNWLLTQIGYTGVDNKVQGLYRHCSFLISLWNRLARSVNIVVPICFIRVTTDPIATQRTTQTPPWYYSSITPGCAIRSCCSLVWGLSLALTAGLDQLDGPWLRLNDRVFQAAHSNCHSPWEIASIFLLANTNTVNMAAAPVGRV